MQVQKHWRQSAVQRSAASPTLCASISLVPRIGEMIINGLTLPTLLCGLVEAQAWKRPDDSDLFREVVQVENPNDFAFLDFDGMKRETDAACALAADSAMARIYGLLPMAQRETLVVGEALLDVTKAVMIAINWDEDAIFLDYRQSPEPLVVLLSWSDASREAARRTLAPNFGEFVRRIGLRSS